MSKTYPRDMETFVNVSPIIEDLESHGLTEAEVKQWFKDNNPDRIHECDMYYEAKNAGDPNPLQIPF